MKRQAQGITLIALVITIIILLILAGISISSLTGSGLFEKAKEAKNRTEEAQELENQILSEYENQMESLGGSGSSGGNSGGTGGEDIPVVPSFDEDTFTLGTNPSDAQNTDKYGWKVPEYIVQTSEMSTNVWRLFYQDINYTYLITDECVGKYYPNEYYDAYQTGADVSSIGQKLNPIINSLFISSNNNSNIKTTAWLTDTSSTGMWSIYKNADAVFSIGSPTAELFVASYNNRSNKSKTITLSLGTYGYHCDTSEKYLSVNDNHGIYNKSLNSFWWLSSPHEASRVRDERVWFRQQS